MELILPNRRQLRTAYDRDIAAAFPPSELEPLKIIESERSAGNYRPWCLYDRGGLVGEAFLWLDNPRWALLDYLCVPPHRRNEGVGGLLVQKMREAEPGMTILAEVEAPEHAPDPEIARRRLEFYERNGARFAGFDSEMFGIHYKLLYWSDEPVPDNILLREYDHVYRTTFSPEKYAKYIRIPRDPMALPMPQVPWDE